MPPRSALRIPNPPLEPETIGTLHRLLGELQPLLLRLRGVVELLPGPEAVADALLRGKTLAEIERVVIERALVLHGGNKAATARSLGIGRQTLYDKLAEARRKMGGSKTRTARPE